MASVTISGSATYSGTTRTVSLTVSSEPGSTTASWSCTSSPSSGTRPYTKIKATIGGTDVLNTSYPSSFPSNANGDNFATYGGTRTGTCTVAAYGDIAVSIGCGVGHNNNTDISKSGTLSKPQQFTVSYNANGGSSTPSSQTVTQGSAVTLASAISRNSSSSDSNATITISYNANGGSSTPGNSTGTAVNTTTTSYSFNKWALNGTGGTQYNAGASYTPTANCTMYATWTSSQTTSRKSNPSITLAGAISRNNSTETGYAVSYNANGGSSTPSSQTSTKTRSYTFSKWNTDSGGTGTDYNASTAYTFSANSTLYAKWNYSDTNNAITLANGISRENGATAGYTITYNANEGTGAPNSETSGNRTITYTFSKWAAGSASGTTYNAGGSYTPSANTTMYATWTSSTSANSSWTCSPIEPTRTGYTFLGWSTNSGASTATYLPGQTYTITAAMTLYAVWKVNYYYLDLNGRLDGIDSGNIFDYGKCDVYINGTKVADQVTEYYVQHPYTTSYEFTNIKPDWGCKYNGVVSGSLKGTIGVGGASTRLSFTRFPVVVNANKDDQWEKGIVWINDNGEWKKARALHIRHEDEWERLEKYDFTL